MICGAFGKSAVTIRFGCPRSVLGNIASLGAEAAPTRNFIAYNSPKLIARKPLQIAPTYSGILLDLMR